jgi:oligoribonuclease
MKDHCSDPHENLCWLDLETTGLDPLSDAILEVGVIITTKKLEHVADFSRVVRPSRNKRITEIDPFVWEMHTTSDLWNESIRCGLSLDGAMSLVGAFIEDHGAKGSPLCGNTIGFDRAFLKTQIPEFLQCLHYRNIDVSTLKNVMAMHFPDVPTFEKPDAPHRVLGDLKLSIEEYDYYLDWMQGGRLNL